MSATKAARDALITSGFLSGLVAIDPARNPAIYADVWAPSSAPFPYVLLNFRSNSDPATSWMRDGTLAVDVFDSGPSQKRAIQLRDAVERALDSSRLIDENGDTYRLGEMRYDAPAATEDSAVTHRSFEFPVRFFRAARLAAMG